MVSITGMYKSGISFIAEVLSVCGFRLATSGVIYTHTNNEKPNSARNVLDASGINSNILNNAGGSWRNPPSDQQIREIGERLAYQIVNFSDSYDGHFFKDPQACLTMSLWERHCNKLQTIIFCVRNPIHVAIALQYNYRLSFAEGLRLWYVYTIRFFNGILKKPVIVVDYDNLLLNLEFEVSNLLSELGIVLSIDEVKKLTPNLPISPPRCNPSVSSMLAMLPQEIKKLYQIILSQTFTYRDESVF